MTPTGFFDPVTIAIVLGGTLIATLLRCGLAESAAALGAIARLGAPRYDAEGVRASLAAQVQQFARDGLLRARPRACGDADLDAGLASVIANRSPAALAVVLAPRRAARVARADRAAGVLWQASELAPVFGLAGTLISLSKLPANGIDRSAYLVAIGMAVHATLYGLIAAHLALIPMARAVERRAEGEEAARDDLRDWLAVRLAASLPVAHPAVPHPAVVEVAA